ncbi:tetratricopeptide repeat protein [Cocleimonas flava]|uniref:Sel1 repeat-containing protein n=1 Tax=Cocleimonas flava TaxID=634765 RepID=A0A4R1EZI1_9GAMM|nr:tetratricopeptide repeat protein [Cocleimonas flava]TCJ87307.1 Sel1 repeat-containing protein [Cocleimonas flava]
MRLAVVISLILLATLFTTLPRSVLSAPEATVTKHSHNGRVHSHILPKTGLKHFHRHSHNGRSHIHPYSAEIGFKHTHNSPQTKPDPNSVKHQHGNRWHSHPLPSSGLNHPHRHKHGGRTHSHPLPATGIDHYHRVSPSNITTASSSPLFAPVTTPFEQGDDYSDSSAFKPTQKPEINIKEIVEQLSISKKNNSVKKITKAKAKTSPKRQVKKKTKRKAKKQAKTKQRIKQSTKQKKSPSKAVSSYKAKQVDEEDKEEVKEEAQQMIEIPAIPAAIEEEKMIETPTEDQQLSATRQFEIGLRYEHGTGIEKNLKQAVKWYRRAAEQGHAKAQFNLASMYESGEGVEKDLKLALKWYKKAAEQGKNK